jgi:iron complex transport system substrate-binding protein
VVIAPCGFGLDGSLAQAEALTSRPGWSSLPAVQTGRVYAVDANSYFARPAPRLVDGVELLAHLFHPGRVDWCGRADAWGAV